MEYRFSLTPRLIALGLFCGVALLILLFTLGYQIGVRMAKPAPVSAYGAEAKERAAALTQQANGKMSEMAGSVTKPLTDQAAALPKAAP